MSPRRVAFVGSGRISRALVRGLVASGWEPGTLRVTSLDGDRARALAADFGVVASTVPEAVEGADLVVLAVHPHQTASALGALAPRFAADQVLVSLVASWPTAAVAAAAGSVVPVVRAVPNVAVAERAGATVLCAGPGAGPAQLRMAEEVFDRLGRVFTVAEDHMEAVSALSGAGPALLARFARAMADGAVAQGVPRPLAEELAGHAVYGTGALLAAAGATVDGLVDAVSSPGGMTARALEVLDRSGITTAVGAAMDQAVRLSRGRMPGAVEERPPATRTADPGPPAAQAPDLRMSPS